MQSSNSKCPSKRQREPSHDQDASAQASQPKRRGQATPVSRLSPTEPPIPLTQNAPSAADLALSLTPSSHSPAQPDTASPKSNSAPTTTKSSTDDEWPLSGRYDAAALAAKAGVKIPTREEADKMSVEELRDFLIKMGVRVGKVYLLLIVRVLTSIQDHCLRGRLSARWMWNMRMRRNLKQSQRLTTKTRREVDRRNLCSSTK